MEPLLTSSEVSKILRVTTQTIGRIAEKGDLPGIRVGSRWRFKREAVEEYISRPMADRKERPAA